MRRFLFIPALFLVFAATNAQDVTFTSNTNLVIIDASVRDKSGKVIPDLKKSDFTVIEDGKPQTISVFEFQRLEGDALLAPVPASKPVAATPAAPAPKAA